MKRPSGSAARRSSWRAPVAVAALLMLPACADPAAPGTASPLAIFWMEWPAAVTAAAPGAMLLQVGSGYCSTASIGITVSEGQITVEGTSIPTGGVCPRSESPTVPGDTLVPLPRLDTLYGVPAYYAIRATLVSPRGEGLTRTAGVITRAAQPDTARYMAGLALLGLDSAGCMVLAGGVGIEHQYAVMNPPAISQSYLVTAGAHVVNVPPPPGCGTRRRVNLDYVEAALIP